MRDRINGAEAGVYAADDSGRPVGQPLWRRAVGLDGYVHEGVYEIPELPDGKYIFTLQLQGGDGVPAEPVTQPFVRRVFPWEHNTLGISDQVMPPFEPLTVDSGTVRAVLRQHRHGLGGLWDELTAQGQSLLAAPMVWEVEAAGSQSRGIAPAVRGDGWRATQVTPTAVAGQADWSAGPLKAQVRTQPADQPKFGPGLLGQALVLGTGGAIYPREGNLPLASRGALAVWVKPENWQRPRDGNTVFVMTSNTTFYLERQGPDIDDDGRVRRHEGILYLANLPGSRAATINGGSDWQNGRWYLLVANWAWPNMELSVNGQDFAVLSLPDAPQEGAFGDLVVGDRAGQPHGLLDELLVFRRPLALDEVQLLWRLRASEGSLEKNK